MVNISSNVGKIILIGKFAYAFLLKFIDYCYVKYHKHDKGIKLLGLKLKSLRKDKSISQEQLANMCDFEISQISRIERGVINTSVSSIFTIAEKLKISPKDLFDFEEEIKCT